MADNIVISAEPREEQGSQEARRMRHAGWVPAVVNDRDGVSTLVKLNRHDFSLMLQHHTSESMVADLDVAGEKGKRKVLLKEVQHEPVTGDTLHADFVEISMTEKMRMNIPLELTGEAVGVNEGGVLDHHLRELEVECLPGDIVDYIEVDVSGLNIGDTMVVGDLTVDSKFIVHTGEDMAIASVLAPRVEEEVEEGEAEEEGAEPEVISGKKEAEESQEESSSE